MGRAPCCEKVGLKKGKWTAEEDRILTKYIQANGEGSWRSLPKKAGLLRCGKSCRLRWVNYLRADLKRGNITTEEEEIMIKLHATFGKRWSLIASHLPGRTDNELKNHWNTHLRKRIIQSVQQQQQGPADDETSGSVMQNNKKDAIKMKKRKSCCYNKKDGSSSQRSEQDVPIDAAAERSQEENSSVIEEEIRLLATPTREKEPLAGSVIEGYWMDLDPHNNKEETGLVSYCEEATPDYNNNNNNNLIMSSSSWPSPRVEETENEILCFNDVIIKNVPVDLNDIWTSLDHESETNIISSGAGGEERERIGTPSTTNSAATNGESGAASFDSLLASYFDDDENNFDWNWESVIQGHHHHSQQCDEELNFLSLPWQSDQ